VRGVNWTRLSRDQGGRSAQHPRETSNISQRIGKNAHEQLSIKGSPASMSKEDGRPGSTEKMIKRRSEKSSVQITVPKGGKGLFRFRGGIRKTTRIAGGICKKKRVGGVDRKGIQVQVFRDTSRSVSPSSLREVERTWKVSSSSQDQTTAAAFRDHNNRRSRSVAPRERSLGKRIRKGNRVRVEGGPERQGSPEKTTNNRLGRKHQDDTTSWERHGSDHGHSTWDTN